MIRIEYNATIQMVEWVNEEDLGGLTIEDIEDRFASGDFDIAVEDALTDLSFEPTKVGIDVTCDSYSVEEDLDDEY